MEEMRFSLIHFVNYYHIWKAMVPKKRVGWKINFKILPQELWIFCSSYFDLYPIDNKNLGEKESILDVSEKLETWKSESKQFMLACLQRCLYLHVIPILGISPFCFCTYLSIDTSVSWNNIKTVIAQSVGTFKSWMIT